MNKKLSNSNQSHVWEQLRLFNGKKLKVDIKPVQFIAKTIVRKKSA